MWVQITMANSNTKAQRRVLLLCGDYVEDYEASISLSDFILFFGCYWVWLISYYITLNFFMVAGNGSISSIAGIWSVGWCRLPRQENWWYLPHCYSSGLCSSGLSLSLSLYYLIFGFFFYEIFAYTNFGFAVLC